MSGFDKLKAVASEIKSSQTPITTTPRELIGFYGWIRRGRYVNSLIRKDLAALRLTTAPDFETSYIDERIAIAHDLPTQDDNETNQEPPRNFPDPVVRVHMLGAANREPVSVKRDDLLETAITKMLMHDFSQLPVMASERSVQGLVSWKSIGQSRALGQNCRFVRDCMDQEVQIIPSTTSLLEAIGLVYRHDIVLVKDGTNRISGLLTTADLSLEFKNLAEPFLLIREIENHLRRLIDSHISPEELIELRAPGDDAAINSASDLTFGQYVRLFQKETLAANLKLDLNKSLLSERLNEIRIIRNDVMHFSPDGIGEQEFEILRDMVKFLQIVSRQHKAE